ncbi:MAG: PH domain-containing protein [Culicoidibacterales bacterium]
MYVKSKIDWWMHIIFVLINVSITSGIVVVLESDMKWLLVVLGGGITMVNWIYFQTEYILEATQLIIRSGPFRERIAYTDIASARLTENWLSSMALSVERIEIRQKNKNYIMGTTLISPKNREVFLRELQQKISENQKK